MVDISIDNGFVRFELNLEIYGYEAICSVAFQMSDYLYVYFYKGKDDSSVVVNMSYQDEENNTTEQLNDVAKDYLNHLINYNVYKFNAERKYLFRTMLVQKIFDNPDFSEHVNVKDAADGDTC
ncbi:MAG: hypothetical protein ACLFNK_05710 [Candidatus Woesearchaeota archaeon]